MQSKICMCAFLKECHKYKSEFHFIRINRDIYRIKTIPKIGDVLFISAVCAINAHLSYAIFSLIAGSL